MPAIQLSPKTPTTSFPPKKTMRPPISPAPSEPTIPGRYNRGRLMTAAEIRTELFSGAVSEWWIRKHVAPAHKITLGRSTVVWHEYDVRDWLLNQRSAA